MKNFHEYLYTPRENACKTFFENTNIETNHDISHDSEIPKNSKKKRKSNIFIKVDFEIAGVEKNFY